MARDYAPFVRKIEVEVESLDQVKEALEAKADIIMLDNMDNDTMKQAVALIGNQAQSECSGNVTKEKLLEIAEIGVDFVSSGAITYGAPILDFSMKNLRPDVYKRQQQQRVAIARLLLKQGDIIICDEPTGSLDEENKMLVMNLICDLHKKGKTIIMVTHDKTLYSYAKRVIMI